MKIWSIVTLMILLNFTALPTLAQLLDWEFVKTEVVLNEEEVHSHYSSLILNEKTIPKTLCIFDYLKFAECEMQISLFEVRDDVFRLSPLLTVFSPPPEA